jgi:hypothetical protein
MLEPQIQSPDVDASSKKSDTDTFDISQIVKPKPKHKPKEPRYIQTDHEIWKLLNVRLNNYLNCLENFPYNDNLAQIKAVHDFFDIARDQFPIGGIGQTTHLLTLKYLSLVNVMICQFDRASEYISLMKQLIEQKMLSDEKYCQTNIEKVMETNMRNYCSTLILKARVKI